MGKAVCLLRHDKWQQMAHQGQPEKAAYPFKEVHVSGVLSGDC